MKLTSAVAEKLGHYVYLYVDPADNKVFYVGKGKGARVLSHLNDAQSPFVKRKIREIRSLGHEPIIEMLAHDLPNVEAALRIEAAAIELLGLTELSNEISGWRSRDVGRTRLNDLIARYTRHRAKITEPSLLIRINETFRYGMTDIELYDATRGIWRIGENRVKAKYAFAVFQGVIRAIYSIAAWLPAGSTMSTRENSHKFLGSDRWEFVGTIAEPEILDKYLNKDVTHEFPVGFQGPFRYLNIDEDV